MKAMQKYLIVSMVLAVHAIYGLRVGSDLSPSRQNRTFFPSEHTDNEIFGFAVCENGLTLQSGATRCAFDAFFPISGNICLNGGTLFLERDVVFKNPMHIGAGVIDGRGYSLVFPNNVSNFSVPSHGHGKILHLLDSKNVFDNVNSVDWSFDDQFIAMVSEGDAGRQEFQVYAFNGSVLTLRATYDLGVHDAYTIRWHPSSYVVALGQNGTTELKLFVFDPGMNQLTLSDSVDVGRVQALDWNSTGDYLAVGRYDNAYLLVYRVENAILREFYTAYFGQTRSVSPNALDWYPTNSFIAVGLDKVDGQTELQVYSFDGANLTLHAQVETGQNVFAVSWHPSGEMLAAGLDQGAERLRLYDFNMITGSLAIIESAYVNENRAVFGLDWSEHGNYLAQVKNEDDGSHEIRVFHFHCDDRELYLVSGYETNNNVRAVRWSHSDLYLATGDVGNLLRVFCFQPAPLVFKDAKLYFSSDVTIESPLRCEGDCVLNMSGNNLTFADTGALAIAPGATLTIEHASLKEISGHDILCTGSDAQLILRDVEWQQDDNFTFTQGSLTIKDQVVFSGDSVFVYQSDQPLSIQPKSSLLLDVGFTFSYDPRSADSALVRCANTTSKIILNGSTLYAAWCGMQLTHGKLQILRDANLLSEKGERNGELVDNSITLGGNISSHDMVLEVLSGVTLNVKQGSLRYKNVLAQSLDTDGGRSIFLWHESGTSLYVHQNIDARNAIIHFDSSTVLARVPGATILSSIDTSGGLRYLTINN